MIKDEEYDYLLKIKTTGKDETNANLENFPYEPTPYKVLDKIISLNLISKHNYLLDYGAGKGRVDFYFTYMTKCHTLGVEYDQRLYEKALNNKQSFKNPKVTFLNINALKYELDDHIDFIYFFNPFNISTFKKVMDKVLYSFFKCQRQITIIFYYISKEYETYLDTLHMISKEQIIYLDEYSKDNREKISIYKLKQNKKDTQ